MNSPRIPQVDKENEPQTRGDESGMRFLTSQGKKRKASDMVDMFSMGPKKRP
jgi:hypothetical protein